MQNENKKNNIKIDELDLINSIRQNLRDLLLDSDSNSFDLEIRSNSSQEADSSDGEICVIIKKQDLLLDFIDKIQDPDIKRKAIS